MNKFTVYLTSRMKRPLYSLFLLSFLVAIFSSNTVNAAERKMAAGKKVPDFQLTTLDNPNKRVTPTLFKDRVTILNVWSSDCGACKEEHAFLNKLAKNKEVPIIGVDLMDDRKAALAWLSGDGNPYEVVIFDDTGKLSKGLGVYGTPQTFIIDQNGIIRFSHLGELTETIWKNKMQPIINKLSAANSSTTASTATPTQGSSSTTPTSTTSTSSNKVINSKSSDVKLKANKVAPKDSVTPTTTTVPPQVTQ